MTRFQRLYRICAVITSVLAVGTILSGSASTSCPWWGWIVGLLVGATPWPPILLRGGLDRHRRLALGIASCAALSSLILQVGAFVEFVKTGGEGARGEGSPGAVIAAMVLFAMLVTCPWGITVLRGWRALKQTPA